MKHLLMWFCWTKPNPKVLSVRRKRFLLCGVQLLLFGQFCLHIYLQFDTLTHSITQIHPDCTFFYTPPKRLKSSPGSRSIAFFKSAPKHTKIASTSFLLVPSQTPHFRILLNIHPCFLSPRKHTYPKPLSNPLINTWKFHPNGFRSLF